MSRLLWVSSQEDIYCGVKWKRCGVGRGSWEGRKYEASGTGHSFYILGLGNQTLTVSRVEKVDELKSKVETNGRWVPLQIKTFILLFLFWGKIDFWCTSLLFDVCLKWLCSEISGGILALQFVKNCSFLALTCFSWEAFMKLLILTNFKNMF